VITVGLVAPAVRVQRPQPLTNGLASHDGCNATLFVILFRPEGYVSTFFEAAPGEIKGDAKS
jgi:hypothetical protein